MKMRSKLKKKQSRKNFSKGTRVKGANSRQRPMRGGWRL